MLEQLKICGYKGFDSLEMNDLTPITLIGGKNNVGKSSILEAIFMFQERVPSTLLTAQYGWRGVESLIIDADLLWRPVFHKFDLSRELNFIGTFNGKVTSIVCSIVSNQSVGKNGIQVETAPTTPPSILTAVSDLAIPGLQVQYFLEDRHEKTAHFILNRNGIQFSIDDPSSQELRPIVRPISLILSRSSVTQYDLATRYSLLDVDGVTGPVLAALQIIEPNLKSLSVVSSGNLSMVYGDIGLSKKIPITYMGEGMFRLLSIITFMANSQNGVLLIDEVENGIHHSVMPKIWEAIGKASKEYNCQVIATSHSYECLQSAHEGLSEEMPELFSYYRLDRIGDLTKAFRFDHDIFNTALKTSMEVR